MAGPDLADVVYRNGHCKESYLEHQLYVQAHTNKL